MTSALYLFKIVIVMKNPSYNIIRSIREHFKTEFNRLKDERKSSKYYTDYSIRTFSCIDRPDWNYSLCH